MSEQASQVISVKVVAARIEADGVISCELAPVEPCALPAFTAGAHIDVFLPGGTVRQYSLINPSNGRYYEIAVALDAASRGGSRWFHQTMRLGDTLSVSVPRNNFPLLETDGLSVFFAGGIGITPIYSMVEALARAGKPWKLFYAARTRASAAFLDEITALGDGCQPHFDDEQQGLLDLGTIVAGMPANAHFYCCGPTGFLDAYKAATEGRPADHVHWETFKIETAASNGDSFTVELAKSGTVLTVGPDETILEAIQKAGGDAAWSCRNGVCGTCETRVLEGTPDHRDMILSDAEKAAGNTMMICCSRAKSARLRLDI